MLAMWQRDSVDEAALDADESRRRRLWVELRQLHAMIDSGKCERRGASIENVLWEVQSELDEGETGIPRPLFVSLLVNAFGFERRCGVEKKLWRMYELFESVAEEGHLDWRELVCALHGLQNPGHTFNNPTKLLSHFWRVYSLADPADFVASVDVPKIVSLAAITFADLARTRHALEKQLDKASAHGAALKYTSFELFAYLITDVCPGVVDAFRDQLWAQCSPTAKLTYLALEEEASSRWFDRYMELVNKRKARGMVMTYALRKAWKGWVAIKNRLRVISNHKRAMVIMKARHCVQWWHFLLKKTRMKKDRRHRVLRMGARAVCRKRFVLWKRWCGNAVRARRCVTKGRFSVPAGHGFFKLRTAERRIRFRVAFLKWVRWVATADQWEMSGAFRAHQLKRQHLRAWRSVYAAVKRARTTELDAVRQQAVIGRMMFEADQALRDAAARAEAEKRAAKAAEAAELLEIKREQVQWATRRKRAEKQAADRLKLVAQREARDRRIADETQRVAAAFEATWKRNLDAHVLAKREATASWLKSPASSSAFEKELKRISKEFYAAPTRETREREQRLLSLAAIVLIRIEAVLYRDGIILEHFVRQYDVDDSGFLSHHEFTAMLKGLDSLDLSQAQIRQVIRDIDGDDDGYISLEELEASLGLVHEYNGHPASPWRLYIDPSQNVICYHNLRTDEQILEHRMTKKKLKEITRAHFHAQAELAAIEEMRQQRATAWTQLTEDRASRALARLAWRRSAFHEQNRLKWKAEARKRAVYEGRANDAALTLQGWVRGVFAIERFVATLALTVQVAVDLAHRRRYYVNHATGVSSWDPPRAVAALLTKRGSAASQKKKSSKAASRSTTLKAPSTPLLFGLLHQPHEFVLSEDDATGRSFFVRWEVAPDRPLQRAWDKPAGYPRCSRCLRHLALLQCPSAYPGAYCFGCFRGTFDAEATLHHPVLRVDQLRCDRCDTSDPASWRCTSSDDHPKLVGTAACDRCHSRLATSLFSHNDAWARV